LGSWPLFFSHTVLLKNRGQEGGVGGEGEGKEKNEGKEREGRKREGEATIIYYETRTKIHEKEKKRKKNTDHRKHTKRNTTNTSRKTHHMVHI